MLAQTCDQAEEKSAFPQSSQSSKHMERIDAVLVVTEAFSDIRCALDFRRFMIGASMLRGSGSQNEYEGAYATSQLATELRQSYLVYNAG